MTITETTMNANEAFTRIVRTRKLAGRLTTAKLAAATGLSTAAVTRRLSGRVSWKVSELGILGELFGCGLFGLATEAEQEAGRQF